MTTLPLMPKATAVWLIEKTALSFTQIAEFCGMHPLEVQAIADGEVAQGIVGYDPIANRQLTQEEIRRCEANPDAKLKILSSGNPVKRRSKGHAIRLLPNGMIVRMALPSCCVISRSWAIKKLSNCWAPPRTPSPRCATSNIGTRPTSNRAIR